MNKRLGWDVSPALAFAVVLAALYFAASVLLASLGADFPAYLRIPIRVALAALFAVSLVRSPDRDLVSPRRALLPAVLLAAVCGIFAQLAASALGAVICGSDVPGERFDVTDASSWAALVSAVAVAPVFEELVFRGELFRIVSRRSAIAALVGTTLAFALVHAGIAPKATALVFGLVLALVVLRRGSLFPAIAFHAAFKRTSFFAGYIPLTTAAALAVFAPLGAAGIYVLLKGKKNETL